MSLQALLRGTNASTHSLVILQSSAAQSCLPLLRHLLCQVQTPILICNLLYPTKVLVKGKLGEQIQVLDHTSDVPGFSDHVMSYRERLLSAISLGMGFVVIAYFVLNHLIIVNETQPLCVVIDSLDTLLSNLSSKAAVYTYLGDALRVLRTRAGMCLTVSN